MFFEQIVFHILNQRIKVHRFKKIYESVKGKLAIQFSIFQPLCLDN